MPPARNRLAPSRHLLSILTVVTLISVSAVTWFGWRLFQQEEIVDNQRAQDSLEAATDRVVASLQRASSRAIGRVANPEQFQRSTAPTADEVLVVFNSSGWAAYPAGRLLYQPLVPSDDTAPPLLFAKTEALEFQQERFGQSVTAYRDLAKSSDPAVRAAALLRLARVLRKLGDTDGSRKVYVDLMEMAPIRAAGVPVELLARHALADMRSNVTDAENVRRDLLQGRWELTQPQFGFYWSETDRISGRRVEPPHDHVLLADAAALTWREWNPTRSESAQWTVQVRDSWFLVTGRTSSGGNAAFLINSPRSLLDSACAGADVTCSLIDSEGRVVAGQNAGPRGIIRTASETQLPWTLDVRSVQPDRAANLAGRKRFLGSVVAGMVLVLIGGSYVIGRAIRREAKFTHLQSDFVSAVSHEFRSPLTSMRHLSELLALGRVPPGPLQQKYYDTIVSEACRLQRLVETLLNLGRMEAGGVQYRHELLDIGEIVRAVTSEFEPQVSAMGRRVELQGSVDVCRVQADAEALSVVMRNLIDNALKYSPEQPAVWVDWSQANGSITIQVRDQGIGIARSEHELVFGKFVRGAAAKAANVRGTGVGLAMARHIIEDHGGKIRVKSDEGCGSTFAVILPAARRNDTNSCS